MMRKEKYMRIIVSFIIALIISMPIYPSYVFALNTEQYKNLDAPPYDVSVIETTITQELNESVDQCIEKHEETSSLVDAFDNDIIDTLTDIVAMLKALCTIVNGIETILSAINTVLGDTGCCVLEGTPFSGICKAILAVYRAWHVVYLTFKYPCCFATCGTCTGTGDCGLLGGASMSIGGQTLNPEDSIYVSMACLCIPGILLHMRKLKLIYQLYNCCVEEACTYGYSTEACEQELEFQTCMFWEGGIIKAVIGLIANIILGIITQFIASEVSKLMGGSQCLIAWFNLVSVPLTWGMVMNEMDNFDKTYDDPNCEDLGFSTLEDYIPESLPIWLMLEDTNGDGKYDEVYQVSEPSPATGNVVGRITGAVAGSITGMASGDNEEEAQEYESVTQGSVDDSITLNPGTDKQVIAFPMKEKDGDIIGYVPSGSQDVYDVNGNIIGKYDANVGTASVTPLPTPGLLERMADSSHYSIGGKTGIFDTSFGDYVKEWNEGVKEAGDAFKGQSKTVELTDAQKRKNTERAVSRAVHLAFDMILQPTIDEAIVEHCNKSMESSVPEDTGPSDQTLGTSGVTTQSGPCGGDLTASSITAQASYSEGVYSYSYYGVSCSQDLFFQVRLHTPQQFRIIDSQSLVRKEVYSESGSIEDTYRFTEICIHTNDLSLGENGIWCSSIIGT